MSKKEKLVKKGYERIHGKGSWKALGKKGNARIMGSVTSMMYMVVGLYVIVAFINNFTWTQSVTTIIFNNVEVFGALAVLAGVSMWGYLATRGRR